MSDKPPSPLSEEQQALVAAWYQRHGPAVVAEVRRQLRVATRQKKAVSDFSVAGSVWESFLDHHLDEVDLSNDDGVWSVLVRAVRRHCNAWNRSAQPDRHRVVSMHAPMSPERGDSGEGFTHADHRELAPEAAVLIEELTALIDLPDVAEEPVIGRALARLDRRMDLHRLLTALERKVLVLKLAGKTRGEIAAQLDIEKHEVDDAWKSVCRKVEAVGTEP